MIHRTLPDLSIEFAGIKSPNPFWLASAPPTNSGPQVMRAFDAGWGGAVWKALGNPIANVSSRLARPGVDAVVRRAVATLRPADSRRGRAPLRSAFFSGSPGSGPVDGSSR